MPRAARIVVPGLPHHVVQRGNRRQQTFFRSGDYERYVELMAAACERTGTEIWAWCLMPNHVHLLAVPHAPDGLAAVMGSVHQSYTWVINRRLGWQGCLWQGRYFSDGLNFEDAPYVARYIELNPWRARLALSPELWRWSSAVGRVSGNGDRLVRRGLPQAIASAGDWKAYLADGMRDLEEQAETVGTDRVGTGT